MPTKMQKEENMADIYVLFSPQNNVGYWPIKQCAFRNVLNMAQINYFNYFTKKHLTQRLVC